MTTRFRSRSGLDDAFLGVVRPLDDGEEEHEDLPRLRAACDASSPDSRTWMRAIRFLQALDRLERQHRSGTLGAGAYASALTEWHTSVDIEVWMAAVKLTRLADRVIAYRQDQGAPHG